MATKTLRWSRADLARLPDDGNRYEVLDGSLLVSPSPALRHELVLKRLYKPVDDFVARHGLGTAFNVATDVFVGDQSVLVPDLAVFPLTEEQLPEAYADLPAPIFVAEVASPETWRRDIRAKRDAYLRIGVAVYWIVDHESREVTVVRPGHGDINVTDILRWAPNSTDAVLEIALPELFR